MTFNQLKKLYRRNTKEFHATLNELDDAHLIYLCKCIRKEKQSLDHWIGSKLTTRYLELVYKPKMAFVTLAETFGLSMSTFKLVNAGCEIRIEFRDGWYRFPGRYSKGISEETILKIVQGRFPSVKIIEVKRDK